MSPAPGAGRAGTFHRGVSSALADAAWSDVYEKSLDCVHCGLCLSACPTYLETGRETSSPRGRIYLMRGVAEGKIPLGEVVAEEAYLCLGCRACETACPSGVEYGAMLETVRASVDRAGLRTGVAKRLEALGLRVVAHAPSLHLAVGLLALAERLGIRHWLIPLLPQKLRAAHAMLPAIPPASERVRLPERVAAEGASRGRVGFLSGCIMPELFGEVNRATVRVLTKNGFDVVIPAAQGCCGALHAHSGEDTRSRALLRNNMAAFADVDVVVVNSAGCGAAMRSAEHWLEGGEVFSKKVRDVAEFLDDVGIVAPTRRIDATVCYDDPCHLAHGQGVVDAPRRLLEQIPGLGMLAHADPTSCCGAAGIYNLTHPEMASAVLTRKLDALAAADPDIIATGNPGCLLQIQGGAATRGLRARVVHPVTLLDEAYS